MVSANRRRQPCHEPSPVFAIEGETQSSNTTQTCHRSISTVFIFAPNCNTLLLYTILYSLLHGVSTSLRLPSPPPLISVLCPPTFLSCPTSTLTLTLSVPYLSMTAMAPTINPHPQFYALTFMAQMKGCPICCTDSGNHTCKVLPCSYVHLIVPSASTIVQLVLSSIMVTTTTLKVLHLKDPTLSIVKMTVTACMGINATSSSGTLYRRAT